MAPIRIVIADDHSLIRQGIKSIICQDRDMEVVGEAADGLELLELLQRREADMVIMDISMPGMNGIEAMGRIRELHPHLLLLILTMHSNRQYFYHSIAAGAHGYLMKDDSDTELLSAIRRVREGKTYVSPQLSSEVTDEMIAAFRDQRRVPIVQLTEREKQVLQMVIKGYTSKQMAKVLCLSPRTIDHHRASLLKKFEMKSTVDLVKYVLRNSIVVPE